MTKDEALKLALEAFKEINKLSIGENAICLPAEIDTAMDAIKEALAQPEQEHVIDCPRCGYCCPQTEQEPVAYSYTSRITGAQGFSHHPMPRFIDSDSWDIKPLYTTPPQRTWVGLMRGVRVDGETVVISVKGGNEAARELCGALIEEKNT